MKINITTNNTILNSYSKLTPEAWCREF